MNIRVIRISKNNLANLIRKSFLIITKNPKVVQLNNLHSKSEIKEKFLRLLLLGCYWISFQIQMDIYHIYGATFGVYNRLLYIHVYIHIRTYIPFIQINN